MESDLFVMSPPNDDAFAIGYIGERLENIRRADGHLITIEHSYKPTAARPATEEEAIQGMDTFNKNGKPWIHGNYPPVDIWDAGFFADEILKTSKELAAILQELQDKGWVVVLRGRLRKAILKLFTQDYFRLYEAAENSWMEATFRDNPGIELLGKITRKEWEQGERFAYSAAQKRKIMYSFEQVLPIVSEWCMASFSHSRGEWEWPETIHALDISEFLKQDKETLPPSKLKIKKGRERKPLSLTDKLKRDGQRLIRKHGLDDYYEILE